MGFIFSKPNNTNIDNSAPNLQFEAQNFDHLEVCPNIIRYNTDKYLTLTEDEQNYNLNDFVRNFCHYLRFKTTMFPNLDTLNPPSFYGVSRPINNVFDHVCNQCESYDPDFPDISASSLYLECPKPILLTKDTEELPLSENQDAGKNLKDRPIEFEENEIEASIINEKSQTCSEELQNSLLNSQDLSQTPIRNTFKISNNSEKPKNYSNSTFTYDLSDNIWNGLLKQLSPKLSRPPSGLGESLAEWNLKHKQRSPRKQTSENMKMICGDSEREESRVNTSSGISKIGLNCHLFDSKLEKKGLVNNNIFRRSQSDTTKLNKEGSGTLLKISISTTTKCYSNVAKDHLNNTENDIFTLEQDKDDKRREISDIAQLFADYDDRKKYNCQWSGEKIRKRKFKPLASNNLATNHLTINH